MSSFRIRPAGVSDIPVCQQLTREFKSHMHFIPRSALERSIEAGYLWVAESIEGGQAIGFVRYHRRRDGWTTLYDLAVSSDYQNQGVGRRLFYQTPAPIQLWVTDDNPARRFYESLHMAPVEQKTTASGRRLTKMRLYVKPIHIQGNNYSIPEMARREGMAYGTRHTEKSRGSVVMLDINWKNYNWSDYGNLVRDLQPAMAMVADYEDPTQRATMVQQVSDLRALGVPEILVCPKFDGAINDIPADCTIAVSVPSRYAGFLPPPSDVGARRVHLLGGSPNKIKECIEKYANVTSADFNCQTRAAQFKSVWNGKWQRDKDPKKSPPYFECAVTSGYNISRAIQEWKGMIHRATKDTKLQIS